MIAQPGWYPDPAGAPATERYWDGAAWAATTRPSAPSFGYPPPTAAPGLPAPSAGSHPPPGYPVAPAHPYGPYGQPVNVAPKNPAVSLLVSFFIPGVGSMINGDVGTGVAILAMWFVGIILTFFIIGIVVVFAAWVWGLVDAYKGAQRWNARHGIMS